MHALPQIRDLVVELGREERLASHCSLVAWSNREGEVGASVNSLSLLEVHIFRLVPNSVSHGANVYFAMLWKVALLLVSFLSGRIPRYDLIYVCSIGLETRFVLWLGSVIYGPLLMGGCVEATGEMAGDSQRGNKQHTHITKFFILFSNICRQASNLTEWPSVHSVDCSHLFPELQ